MHFLSVLLVRLVVVLRCGPVIGSRQVDRYLLLDVDWMMLNHWNRYRVRYRHDRLMMLVVVFGVMRRSAAATSAAFSIKNEKEEIKFSLLQVIQWNCSQLFEL